MLAQSRSVAQGDRFATCFQSPPSALPDVMQAGEACERDQDYQTCVNWRDTCNASWSGAATHATAFTRMPLGARFLARDLVKLTIAPLVEA